MNWKKSLDILKRLHLDRGIRHAKSMTSSVTTHWGVNWDEVLIARDIMQNFYDANQGCIGEIRTESDGGIVRITAPGAFNLERLFYLGSDKGPEDVGQYGEGFKVAVTCLLRDHRVAPVARSGRQLLCLRISEESVTDAKFHPLEYDFFSSDSEFAGTELILEGCSKKLIQALKAGLHHFLYEGNPLIGLQKWVSYDGQFSICTANDTKGHVFYRNLKRGEIHDIPVILIIKKEFKSIENKIGKDRDRNAFGEQMMELFYKTFVRGGLGNAMVEARCIVEAARPCWVKGHPLLQTIAQSVVYERSAFDRPTVKAIFGDGYYARSTSTNRAEQMRYDTLEREWHDQKKQALPAYFAKFGVLSAEAVCKERDEKARKESERVHSRRPTPAEMTCIQILSEILQEFAPQIMASLRKKRVHYTVARTEVLLGQLRQNREYGSLDVFFAEYVFVAEFSEALAVFLHEHAYVFGSDGSRGFTDALTELIETIVQVRTELDAREARWNAAREIVSNERKVEGPSTASVGLDDKLNAMNETELRDLLLRVPPVVLRRLLSGEVTIRSGRV